MPLLWLSTNAKTNNRQLLRYRDPLQQLVHIGPQYAPRLAFVCRQVVEGAFAHTGKVDMVAPTLQSLDDDRKDFGVGLLSVLAPQHQIRTQPCQRLLAPLGA